MRKGNSVKRKYVIAIVSVVTALVVAVGGFFAYKQYTLMKAKDTAIEKISDVNYSDYRKKEQKEIKALVKDGKEQIDEAKSKEAVNIIAKNMKSDIAKVKTAAEIKTAEAQNKAIKSLNGCINKSNYRSEEKKQVEKIISEYTKKIRKETDEKTIRKLLEEGKSKLGDIKTDSQYESEESAAAAAASGSGSSGSSSSSGSSGSSSKKSGSSRHSNSAGCVGGSAKDLY